MAKKQAEILETKSKLQDILDRLEKAYGKGTVLTLDGKTTGKYETFSSGSLGLDYITLGIGGFAKGKLYELMGWEGCEAQGVRIKFITTRADGTVQDCKGSSIKNLYRRFHNRTDKTRDSMFNVISINEENKVFRNPIADVVKCGVKECFEVTTMLGFKLQTTKDHKYYVGNDYIALEKLNVGDTIFVHNNTHFKKVTKKVRNRHSSTTMKWYYKNKIRPTNGSLYFTERVHRLIYEAYRNNISYQKYKDILNSGIDALPKDFWTIPEGYDIHHVDENIKNNKISNLQLIKNKEHTTLHALQDHNNLRFIVVPDKIISIVSIGSVETYDIKCYTPYNNYISQGIVVHNSGKSTICGHAVAECQKKGGRALFIDGEYALDKEYFQSLGVDASKMLIAQPTCGEEGFNILLQMINSGQIDLAIIDSDSSLIPKSVVEGEIGDSAIGKKARLNNNAYPSIKAALVRNKVCVIVVSQYREKIGVMFGNPTTTQGGHALKFYTDCRLEINRAGFAKENDVIEGCVTKVKATKNKMFPPYRQCEFDIIYGQGIDIYKELVDLAVNNNIVVRSGSWYSYGETKIGQGQDSVVLLLRDNPELCEELREKVILAIRQEEAVEILAEGQLDDVFNVHKKEEIRNTLLT